ncbi:M4 family metallopeptidase [Bacillus wiedmannii]|uniref:M4 family metallopeptidase n=1 Tax=Bacillus wiedmannii TaxID=1890302 RepID=UPI000BF3A722|nr:M4 family metallopeptidase [Bacillus wiedmannii]MDR4943370.1 M4 family metallopeptidase [Bacillus wiedmannii]PGD68231.1 peptidase M4 family protein [Bacillus wiedmannii]
MKNKTSFVRVGVTTGVLLSAIMPFSGAYAATEDLKVETKEDTFRAGNLTAPSQKPAENVAKDALKGKTEQALSSQQINTESKVNYNVTQSRKSYDGTTLVRLQQTYEGRDVYGFQLTAHINDEGVLTSVLGDSAQELQQQEDLNQFMTLSKEDAKNQIFNLYGNDLTFIEEPEIKEVVYVDENTKKARNAYQINFSASTPEYVSGTVLIDAFNGNLLKEIVQKLGIQVDSSIVQSATSNKSQDPSKLTGAGKDDLGINRTFGISQRSDGTYILADYSRGKGIETYTANYKDYNNYKRNAWGYLDDLVTSNSTNFTDPKAVSAHYLATKVYDFYQEKYGRNSFDNNGQKVISVVHGWNTNGTNKGNPKQWFNAFSNGAMLVYGDPIVRAFDVAGHEFTHAVTRNESGLEYAGEAGAINEALSDILGVAVEKYANNGKFNWTMGEQSGRIFRDMKNPSSISSRYPEDYEHYNHLPIDADHDHGGVHTNSSIINKVAYLIASGGKHNGVNIQGIGEDKMFDIFYYVNTDELNMTSDFKELKEGCIRVATNLYGKNSSEVQAVQQAFKAAYI